eukprot:4632028-Prorocentrum_lima.AAC.1
MECDFGWFDNKEKLIPIHQPPVPQNGEDSPPQQDSVTQPHGPRQIPTEVQLKIHDVSAEHKEP